MGLASAKTLGEIHVLVDIVCSREDNPAYASNIRIRQGGCQKKFEGFFVKYEGGIQDPRAVR